MTRRVGASAALNRPNGPEVHVFYPLTVVDFLDRAETVYPDRTGIVDEPDQPAPSLGALAYREVAANARPRPRSSTRSTYLSEAGSQWSRRTPPGCARPSSGSAAGGGCSSRSTSG